MLGPESLRCGASELVTVAVASMLGPDRPQFRLRLLLFGEKEHNRASSPETTPRIDKIGKLPKLSAITALG